MELNGTANIKMIVQMVEDSTDLNELKKALQSIEEQADYLTAYLTEIFSIIRKNDLADSVPYWHEVRKRCQENPGND